jgi:hypothetical protein
MLVSQSILHDLQSEYLSDTLEFLRLGLISSRAYPYFLLAAKESKFSAWLPRNVINLRLQL